MKKVILTTLLLISSCAYSNNITACFTPGGNCTQQIVDTINTAQHTIDVQAYNFTSMPIMQALASAEDRGVKVEILLDKSNSQQRYQYVTSFLQENNIPFMIDYRPAIAHNKVMVIDDSTVITGSFNFTDSAQKRNAENLLIIHDPTLAQQYEANFNSREKVSLSLTAYQQYRLSKKK